MIVLETIIKVFGVVFLILLFVSIWNRVFGDGDLFD